MWWRRTGVGRTIKPINAGLLPNGYATKEINKRYFLNCGFCDSVLICSLAQN
jgi:hypothetical protein